MKNAILAILAAGAACAFAGGGDVVFRCDFAANTRVVDAESVGKMHGALPNGWAENFTTWKHADVRTEVVEEDGLRFLRLETRSGEGGQFCFPGLHIDFPGVYMVRIRARLVTAQALNFGVRQHGPPYHSYWKGEWQWSEWSEREFVMRVRKDDGVSGRGVFIYTTRGIADIASMEIVRMDEAAYSRMQRRPDPSVVHLLKRYRFPFGLPSGGTVEARDGTACLDDSAMAEDGIATLGVTGGVCTVYSEPFQTNEPDVRHEASFMYRTAAGVRLDVAVARDDRWEVASAQLKPSEEWTRGTLAFKAPGDVAALTLRFSGNGAFAIDRTDVTTKAKSADRGNEPTVTLQSADGEIARRTRVQFEDEPAVLRGLATDVPDGAEVVLRATDLYGAKVSLGKVAFPKGGKSRAFEVRYDAFKNRPLGQFRVQARLVKGGVGISRTEEFVVTRVRRPVAWGKDAPDSPFGSHFVPSPERLEMMKACGVNWMRLHDAGTELSGWWALEAEKGKWKWPDDTIARIRKAGIRVFAQLGTAPAWATHYDDLGCTRMGYFEKYLRPVDMSAWTNYVMRYVARYAGKIDDYFIWNEPWGEWWSCAKDVKYYDKDRAGEDFGAFSRITYDAAKRANPKADICGINTLGGWPGSNWTARVCSGGGYAGCDSIDFHIYSNSKRLLRGEDTYSDRAFSFVRAAWPNDAKPVIMSEGQGASAGSGGGNNLRMSGLYSATVPWNAASPDELALFSDKTCRYVIALLAEQNMKRVFLYTTHGFKSLGQKPFYQTLLGADGYPHPSFAAFSQMAAAIEGKRFVRRVDFGSHNGVRVDFAGRGGVCRVYANLTKAEAAAIAAKSNLFDLYGNRFDPDRFFNGTLVYEVPPN